MMGRVLQRRQREQKNHPKSTSPASQRRPTTTNDSLRPKHARLFFFTVFLLLYESILGLLSLRLLVMLSSHISVGDQSSLVCAECIVTDPGAIQYAITVVQYEDPSLFNISPAAAGFLL